MKKIFNWSFVIVMALTALGCQQDLFDESIKSGNRFLNESVITRNDIETMKNKSLLETIDKVKASRVKSVDGRMVYDSVNKIWFDDELGLKAEYEGKSYYTFAIYKMDEPVTRKLENIIFSEKNNGEFEVFVAKYDFTKEEFFELDQGILKAREIQFEVAKEGRMQLVQMCIETSVGHNIYPPCNHEGGHSNGAECEPLFVWQVTSVCSWGLLGGSESYNYDGAGSGTTAGGGTHGGGGTVVTGPWYPSEEFLRKKNFTKNSLRDYGVTDKWVQLTNDQRNQILDYLEGHELNLSSEYNPKGVQFAIGATIAMSEGGGANFNDEIIYDPSYFSNPKLPCVYTKMMNNLPLKNYFKNAILNMFESNRTTKLTFKVATLPPGYSAMTEPSGSFSTGFSSYVITFDTNFIVNASPLEIAEAMIHEVMHAELVARLMQMGIIVAVNTHPVTHVVTFQFASGSTMSNADFGFWAYVLSLYRNANGANPSGFEQWNHQMMTEVRYRDIIMQSLMEIYPNLNDPQHDFINAINSDPANTFGAFTLSDAMGLLAWIGLESTSTYNTNFPPGSINLAKVAYINNVSRTLFNPNCN